MIPKFLYKKLIEQYGNEITEQIIEGYKSNRKTTIRVNLIKSSIEKIEENLKKEEIKYNKVLWGQEAFILDNVKKNRIQELGIYKYGEIYLQSLSSMLPVLFLEPKSNENILDMAAAPGGKTTQIASITKNTALITACEKNKIRADRLKYNIEKQGARVNILREDARKLSEFFCFDKILLDAPCSGSGTLEYENENNQKIFTEELIKRSIKTQFELLQKAVKMLKKGNQMIYSTCSILKEENEENIKKILKSGDIELIELDQNISKQLPQLPGELKETITVMPNELYEGFFIAKLRKR
jgi:NOL1/NOP2/sun family putative RNA methylase